jgi:transcription termination factor Rho
MSNGQDEGHSPIPEPAPVPRSELPTAPPPASLPNGASASAEAQASSTASGAALVAPGSNGSGLPGGATNGAHPAGQQGQPGQPGEARRGRRRRRRRRRGGQPGQPGQQGQAGQPGASPANGQVLEAGAAEGGAVAQVAAVAPPAPQLQPAEGILDYDGKGNFGYLRQVRRNMLPGGDDPEVPRNLIQRLRLRAGQQISGSGAQRGPRVQLQRIEGVDGRPPELASRNPQFQDLTVIDPERRIQLEHSSTDMVTRVLDLISPIGFGQRGLIVSPPKAGKTIMLQRIAQAITENHPKAHLMVLLVDERPEEVTDMRRNIKGEVLASSSDRPTSDHLQVAEMCLDRGRRLVEEGRDVVILLDSITRLARAYNKEVESSGRTLTGGVDSRALERPKRIFGSARKTEEAGSLTILGTALIDTGSRMDEVIFEEFKGTGNMEVTLDRQLAERRIFPAINIPSSGTRKEEKLMTPKEYEKIRKLRQMLYAMKPADAMEKLVKKLAEFDSNDEFLDAV